MRIRRGAPPSDDEALELQREAADYVTQRAYSAFPGTSEAIRALHEAGYVLHTASGESSRDLHHYLTGMGVRDCFQNLYGTDIVDIWKGSPEYYRRIIAHAGVAPAEALVVEDSAPRCAWAVEAGARVVQNTDTQRGPDFAADLAELAARLIDG